MEQFKVEWIDHHREPQCKPDPEFPDGKDLDCSFGSDVTCEVMLPHPAKRCGVYVIECSICGRVIAVTTAGRPDDPRNVKMACNIVGDKQ